MFYKTRVIAIVSFTLRGLGIRDFLNYFTPVIHDPMTFIYELDPYSLEIYRMCEKELPMSRLLKVIILQTYIQKTDMTNYTPRHTASRVV